MDCETFQAELPELLYGELETIRREPAEAHAAECPACRLLLGELRAVRESLPRVSPPSHLAARIKLAARDQLLDQGPPSIFARGGPLHAVALGVLAASLGLASFGLGIVYERGQHPGELEPRELRLPVPRAPSEVEAEPDPNWIEIRHEPDAPSPVVPRASVAWQRVLFDAGRLRLTRGEAAEARDFFQRAAEMDPEGSLATGARIGAAEALLSQGRMRAAQAELERIRRQIIAGTVAGNEAMLQRIAELSGPAPEAE